MAAALSVLPPPGGVLPEEVAAYDAMLASQVRAANNQFSGSACPDAHVEVVSIKPWRVSEYPDNVFWREKVRVTGCGHTAIDNINIGRMGGSPPWRMKVGLPGDSQADMNLQETTIAAAAAAARSGLAADCRPLSLNDIYIAARPGGVDVSPPGSAARPTQSGRPGIVLPENVTPTLDKLALSETWMEVWPFNVCGRDRTLGVVFIPLKDHSASLYLFLPVWQQIEAHGPGARPVAVPAEE